jgi:hypothetical protein
MLTEEVWRGPDLVGTEEGEGGKEEGSREGGREGGKGGKEEGVVESPRLRRHSREEMFLLQHV